MRKIDIFNHIQPEKYFSHVQNLAAAKEGLGKRTTDKSVLRDLDAAISALQHSPGSDLLQVQRLKKRKLYLRDRISHIEDQLTPDIIA